MKVSLITGVAGTIGSNLAKFLIKKNHTVIGLDNLSLGKLSNLKILKKKKNFFFYKVDVSKESELKKIEKKIPKLDYLWLLSANSDIRAGIKNFQVDLENTFMTTYVSLNFFKNKLKKKNQIIFSSSSAVYGKLKKKISENNKIFFPISNYGESKLISEIYIKNFAEKNNLNYLILRFPNVVGKPFTHGVIFDLANKIKKHGSLEVLGNGYQQKPYAHVSEIVNCMYFLINKKNTKKEYLLGPSGNGTKVREIVEHLKNYFKVKNKKVIYQKKNIGWRGDVPKYSYNTSRLKKEGFRFKYSSLEAVKISIKEKFFM